MKGYIFFVLLIFLDSVILDAGQSSYQIISMYNQNFYLSICVLNHHLFLTKNNLTKT